MKKLIAVAAIMPVIAGCSTMQIVDTGEAVTITGIGSALGSAESVVESVHSSLKAVCEVEESQRRMIARPGALKWDDDLGIYQSLGLGFRGFLDTAEEAATKGKSILDSLFGSHSYTVTRACD